MNIVRGTTPTIRYTFTTVDASRLVVAKLVIEQDTIVIEKDLADGSVGEGYVEWTLSQADTLSLSDGKNAKIKLDWLLQDGTRGIGNSMSVGISNSAINEVINA